MSLVLPSGHPAFTGVSPRDAGAVRIGIVNIMPRLEEYEPNLLRPLAALDVAVEPVFLRLTSHAYGSSDTEHLDRFYRPFSPDLALDGLILTGAPIEELAFEDVHYWRELESVLAWARTHARCTLGLCWGGMALGRMLGVEKSTFAKKLFGVFEDRVVGDSDLLPGSSFVCAHSRHSGMREDELSRAEGVRILSHGDESGSTMFETTDGRYIAHLGHPEYEGSRLAFEWNRDRALGRTDVFPPAHFDAEHPTTPWRAHRDALFRGFVKRAARTPECD